MFMFQPVAADRRAIPVPIERTMAFRQGSENPVEKKKSNPKILIHSPIGIERPMMNVVKAPGLAKPPVEYGCSFHPEILDVHPVMQIAEHEDRPNQQGCHRKQTVGQRYV